MSKLYLLSIFIFFLSFFNCQSPFKSHDDNGTNQIRNVTLEEIWRIDTGLNMASTHPPAYSDGIVYYIVEHEGLYASEAATGKIVWKSTIETSYFLHSLVRIFVDENHVYATMANYLYCFEKKTGVLRYSISNILTGAKPDDKYVYVVRFGPNYGYLSAVDKNTGGIIWSTDDLPAPSYEVPAIDDNYLYLTFSFRYSGPSKRDGFLVKIDKSNGEIVFNKTVKMPQDTIIPYGSLESPVIYDDLVIIENGDVSGNSRIYAFNKHTGDIVWTYFYEGAIRYALNIEGSTLYFATQSTDLIALNAENGDEIWKTDIMRGSCITGPVAIIDDLLFVLSSDSYLYCFSRQDGNVLYKMKDLWDPIVYNDTLFAGGYTDITGEWTYFFSAHKIVKVY